MELNKIGGADSAGYYAAAQQAAAQKQQQPQKTNAETVQSESGTESASAISATQGASSASDRVKLTSTVTLKNVDTVRAIEQMHTRINEQIKSVRKTNEVINQQADGIEKLTTTLNTIMKNFPPFTMDSKERQEILMSYTSIRKEIMKMLVPPPPAQVYEQVKDTWKTVLAENGQLQPGAVPALQSDSPDAALGDAANELDKSAQTLASLSSSITERLFQG
ncbi:MAG: hypothetical protein A2X80_03700 [Geobacteraceae bacterium GWB2_52_12]|nr:MAG: hypothetical protein A2X80_03700 [Geobacteraceae bacterium GWB2_52_12]